MKSIMACVSICALIGCSESQSNSSVAARKTTVSESSSATIQSNSSEDGGQDDTNLSLRQNLNNGMPRREYCTPAYYLQIRPDVAQEATYRSMPFGPLTHYDRHGRNEGMCVPSLNIPYDQKFASYYFAKVRKNINNADVELTTSNLIGGSFVSMIYRGQEYIDAHDHGREMQTAGSFNDAGECLNPTEGGGRDDGTGLNLGKTNVNKIAVTENTGIYTSSNMAYWLRPGTDYGSNCGATQFRHALNSTATSDHVLQKTVTFGFEGIQNVLEYNITWTMPREFDKAAIETVTGYMPAKFSKPLSYNPSTDQFEPVALTRRQFQDGNYADAGAINKPIIVATADGQHAMGIYSPSANSEYTAFFFLTSATNPGVSKWNVVDRQKGVFNQNYNYRNFVTFGTLEENKNAIRALYKRFSGRVRGDITSVSQKGENVYIYGWSCLERASTQATVILKARKKGTTTLIPIGRVIADQQSPEGIKGRGEEYCPAVKDNMLFRAQIPVANLKSKLGGNLSEYLVYAQGIASTYNNLNRDLFLGNSGYFTLPQSEITIFWSSFESDWSGVNRWHNCWTSGAYIEREKWEAHDGAYKVRLQNKAFAPYSYCGAYLETPAYPTVPGEKFAGGGAARVGGATVELALNFYDANMNFVSAVSKVLPTGAWVWQDSSIEGVAPANAKYVKLRYGNLTANYGVDIDELWLQRRL